MLDADHRGQVIDHVGLVQERIQQGLVGARAAHVLKAGVLGVTGTGNIAATAGQNPALSFTGILPIANGGIGLASAPSAAGQYLRASGAGKAERT